MNSINSTPLKHIGIFACEGADEFDIVAPWEVLALWTTQHPEDGYQTSVFSPTGGPVTGSKGLSIGAMYSIEAAPDYDVVIFPGGPGIEAIVDDPVQLEWVRSLRANTPVLVSVCTAGTLFASAGFLSGRPATTHERRLERVAGIDPSILLRPLDRYVDDGDVVTSQGISAAIDVALHLVARFAGEARAAAVRDEMQYEAEYQL
ncbi:transcriptional regulator GlxA family with amidase domain [Microbacterium sp. BE35]|uniref:DJ-1/PfpI family protein n=1 Tax=Microbacterium sp. BE35 TaxID=2817773 RepID=UPI002867ABD6|nr:DJ-1/PfpI family protein [Microbacterium sp. BE35]MDR7188181.1 transcriptional regulator GlxA family with amidase domain [Microbacterium sp. BE35]